VKPPGAMTGLATGGKGGNIHLTSLMAWVRSARDWDSLSAVLDRAQEGYVKQWLTADECEQVAAACQARSREVPERRA